MEIVNSIFNSKIDKSNVSIYVYGSRLIKQLPSENCNCMNGSMMILQINEKLDDSLIAKNENNMMINKKLSQIKKLYKSDDKKQPEKSSVFNYFDLVIKNAKVPIEWFFKSRRNTKRVIIYCFEDMMKPVGIIEVPTRISCINLIQFIQSVFKIRYNDDDEIFLLFNYDSNLDLPSLKPVDQFNQPFSANDKTNEIILYYSIVSKDFALNSTSKTRIVQLSKDGIKLDKTVGYYWPDSYIHPFEQFSVIHDSFFKDQNKLRYRMFLVDKNKDVILFDNDNKLTFDNETVLRIEKIPQNQLNKDLVVLQKVTVGKYDRFVKIGIPFFFIYIDNENVADFRKRLCSFFGYEIANFKVHGQSKYIDKSHFLNDKIHCDTKGLKSLYLIFDNN